MHYQTYTEIIDQKADLVIYSFDRPLQLYSLLESIHNYVAGLGTITVIYRTSNEQFEAAYQEIKNEFCAITMEKQSLNPRADFKKLTMQAVFKNPHKYILFAVDDIIVTDYIDVSKSIVLLQEHQAYGFYFRLGKNLTHCYAFNSRQNLPPFKEVESDVFAWQFSRGQLDWGYPNTVDMALYKKEDIIPYIVGIPYYSPNSFEGCWASKDAAIKNRYGLCHSHTKIVNIPLNVVQQEAKNRNMNLFTSDQLLKVFIDGKKIDIYQLYKIDNKAVHMEYKPTFINRKDVIIKSQA